MSPTNPGNNGTKNSNIDKNLFIIEIVGVVIFILLVLLCFLLHYFRGKCLKPRQLLEKLRLPSTLRDVKKDQSISLSHLSIEVSRCESEFSDSNRHSECSGHQEVVVVDVHENKGCAVEEEDMQTPVLQHTCRASQKCSPIGESSLSRKEYYRGCMSLENMASFSVRSINSLEKTEWYGSRDKEDHKHSFSTKSLFEKQGQAKFQVELPSSYSQKQMRPQHLAGQAISQQHLQEADTDDWIPQHIVVSSSVSIPASLSGELIKEGITEVDRGKPLPSPKAWFVSLDGYSNAVRHSYKDLQKYGRNRINNINLDYGVYMNEPNQKGQMYPQKDLDEVEQSGSECGTAVCSPEENTPRFVFEGERRRSGQLPSLQEETIKRSVESPSVPLPSTERKITGHHEADYDRNESGDDNHQREFEKTPWEKREERPVMIFNLK